MLQSCPPRLKQWCHAENDCFPEFYLLSYLQHLSLSWCYDIPETLLELGENPTLKTLQVFVIVPDGTLQLLKEALPHLQINSSHFTTITRPTIGNKKNKRYGASNADCHWRSPVVYEASIARWCLLFSLNRESKKEAQLWRTQLFLFLVFCCLPSTSILENQWREKTMKCCFLEITMKAFITAIPLRAYALCFLKF